MHVNEIKGFLSVNDNHRAEEQVITKPTGIEDILKHEDRLIMLLDLDVLITEHTELLKQLSGKAS
jgi:hypothetical protein